MRSHAHMRSHTQQQSGALLFPTGNGFKVLVFCHICDINSFAFNLPCIAYCFDPRPVFAHFGSSERIYISYAFALCGDFALSVNYNCSEFVLLDVFSPFLHKLSHSLALALVRLFRFIPPNHPRHFFYLNVQKYAIYLNNKKSRRTNERNQWKKKHANQKIVAIKYKK